MALSNPPTADPCLLIVITYNQLSFTQRCIESIQRRTQYPYRLLVIDNGSDDRMIQYLQNLQRKDDRVFVIFNKQNLGWIGAVNQGLTYGEFPYYCVMNNDLVVYPGWLEEMVKVAESDKMIGLVNPEWNLGKGYAQDHRAFYHGVVKRRKEDWIETDYVRGFCFLIKRDVVEKVGGLDPLYGNGYYEDWDYSMRAIQVGFRCARALKAFVYHHMNVTFKSVVAQQQYQENFQKNEKIFYKRWGRPLRVLWIWDDTFEQECPQARDLIEQLLRQQNRLYVFSPLPLSIRHTNCLWRQISSGWLTLSMWVVLFNSLRFSGKKRYHLIVCSKAMSKHLDKGWIHRSFKLCSTAEIANNLLREKMGKIRHDQF
jgi:GT2 family glycosyltransferase